MSESILHEFLRQANQRPCTATLESWGSKLRVPSFKSWDFNLSVPTLESSDSKLRVPTPEYWDSNLRITTHESCDIELWVPTLSRGIVN